MVKGDLVTLPNVTGVHNVYILEYLFLQTEQAGTYLKICHLLYHSKYICPILFSPKEHGEISIFVSLKLLICDFPSIIPLYHIKDLGHKTPRSCEYTMKFDYSPVAYTGQFRIQENRIPECTHCALYTIHAIS